MSLPIYESARIDAYQDACENAPFSSVGGIDKRAAMEVPERSYLQTDEDAAEYLRGYRSMAQEMYGEDWQTCTFSWRPALTIVNDPAHGRSRAKDDDA